jgi:hypothetical protein
MSTVPIKLEKKMSVLDQLKKLEEQRAKLLDGAKEEALTKAKAAIAELNELGFSYTLNAGGKKAGLTRQRDPEAACSICEFATVPGHDGRMHRSQGKNKKPFTAKELEEQGLKKR